MADSWEDNDDVPVIPVAPQPFMLPKKAAWDDEEEVRLESRTEPEGP
jgi:hypothetical protein